MTATGSRVRRVDWQVVTVAVALLVVVVLFGRYLTHRQSIADQRNERDRRDLCAILSTIPGAVPLQITKARKDFARDGHPRDCQPAPRPRTTPRPTPTATATATPTVVVVPIPGPTRTVTASPTPTPNPTTPPRPTRSPKPSPTPSPSRTCVAVICLQ